MSARTIMRTVGTNFSKVLPQAHLKPVSVLSSTLSNTLSCTTAQRVIRHTRTMPSQSLRLPSWSTRKSIG